MKGTRQKVSILFIVALLLVFVHLVNTTLDGALNQFGVIPRSLESLHHLFFAPFIHVSWGHLYNNLLGLAVFSVLCLLRSTGFYLVNSLTIIIVSGLVVWVAGRTASHIGASGWVFGLWSLSIATAWFDRRLGNIFIAMLVIVFYSGLAYGVLPNDPGVSFEMHLAGAVAGVVAAFLYSPRSQQ